MVSLKASMRVEEVQVLFQAVCNAYAGLLRASQDAVIDLSTMPGDECRKELTALASRGQGYLDCSRTDLLPALERDLRRTFRQQADKVSLFVRQLVTEKERTVAALEDMVAATATSASQPISDVGVEIHRLQHLAALDDLKLMRTGIRESADRLHTSLESIIQEKNAAIAMLRDEIRTLQRSVEELRPPANDLLSRAKFEACAEAAIASGVLFSVVQIRICNRLQLERFRGQAFADSAIREFGTELLNIVPPEGSVGHWSESDFFVLMKISYSEAIPRAREIAALLQRTPKSAPNGTSMHLSAQFLTIGFEPHDGADKLISKLRQMTAVA